MVTMTFNEIQGATQGVSTDTDPVLQITETQDLDYGDHRFRLVVTDNDGYESNPVIVTISVMARPIAEVTVMDAQGEQPLRNNQVLSGTNFVLRASASDPDGGTIENFLWRYDGPVNR